MVEKTLDSGSDKKTSRVENLADLINSLKSSAAFDGSVLHVSHTKAFSNIGLFFFLPREISIARYAVFPISKPTTVGMGLFY